MEIPCSSKPKSVSVDTQMLRCKGLATFLAITGRGREGQGCEKLSEWASCDRNRWDFVVTHPQRAHSFTNIQYLMASNKILTKFFKARIPDYILWVGWDTIRKEQETLKRNLLEFRILQHNSSWEEKQIRTYRLFLSGCWENTNIKTRGISPVPDRKR